MWLVVWYSHMQAQGPELFKVQWYGRSGPVVLPFCFGDFEETLGRAGALGSPSAPVEERCGEG